MNVFAALYYKLSNDSGVSTLAGTRIYPSVIPQDASYPAIAYQQISGHDTLPHDGPTNYQMARYQITCVAETYLAAANLALAVQAALDGESGTMGGTGGITVHYCHVMNLLDGYNTGTETHTVRVDVVIWFSE